MNLQTCKYTLFYKFLNSKKYFRLERGWISRLKKYHDLQICTRPTCRGILCDGTRNFFFSNRKYFFSNLQPYKKKWLILKFVNSKKNTSGWKIFFCDNHCLEYRDRYVVCKFECRGIFLSEISSRGAKVPLKMHENNYHKLQSSANFFAQRGFMGIFNMSFLIPC